MTHGGQDRCGVIRMSVHCVFIYSKSNNAFRLGPYDAVERFENHEIKKVYTRHHRRGRHGCLDHRNFNLANLLIIDRHSLSGTYINWKN